MFMPSFALRAMAGEMVRKFCQNDARIRARRKGGLSGKGRNLVFEEAGILVSNFQQGMSRFQTLKNPLSSRTFWQEGNVFWLFYPKKSRIKHHAEA